MNGFTNEITSSLAFGRRAATSGKAKRCWRGRGGSSIYHTPARDAAAGKSEATPKSASGTLVPARWLQLPRACAMAGSESRQVREQPY